MGAREFDCQKIKAPYKGVHGNAAPIYCVTNRYYATSFLDSTFITDMRTA